MITGIIIALFAIIGIISIMSAVKEEKTPAKGIIIILVGIVIGIFQPYSVSRIDAGNKGLKINLSGNERGVSNYQYKTGWVLYNTWSEQLLQFPMYQQHIEYDDQTVITKGGFSTTIKPTFNYSLRSDAVGDMFVSLRLSIKEVEQGWLKTAIVSAVNDVANIWEVDSIFNHRQAFEAAIVAECNVRVSKWFNVSQLRTNITPPDALQDAINSKTKAIQQAQASIQQAIAAEAEGKRKIAVAKADSAELIINAKAAALAIKLKQQEITPQYIEYVKWSNAADNVPRVPSVVGAGNIMHNFK